MAKSVHDLITEVSPYYKKKKSPETKHTLGYDSATEQLEPIYFFILDLMKDFGFDVKKISDSFTSSPGSGHFSDLGMKSAQMQQQVSQTMEKINAVVRSVLNILYDLKDMKTRIEQYNALKTNDKATKEAARLSLKQIWMDKVDMTKGNSSIKAMALGGQAEFSTLIDAFLTAKDVKDINNLDLNLKVKRILKPRLMEFNQWFKESGKQLKKRYELEKNYLQTQVNSLKLYSRWVKPYLRAAQELEQKEQGSNPDIIKTFNTILLELTLLGKSKVNLKSAALDEEIPGKFAEEKFLKKQKRDYYKCILTEFHFRGIPQKTGQQGGFAFGGKTTVTFKAYVLNNVELEKLEKELGKEDIKDVLQIAEGTTEKSLDQMQEEIDSFLKEKEEDEKKQEKPKDINPFLALIGKYDKKEKQSKDKKPSKEIIKVEKDSWIEANIIRPYVANQIKDMTFKIFNTYKKAHGMATFV